jgi:alkanesulfonate monooxygenase SsuD/methylene tetrahydromethanopterin reductase-like flavin-dependent oxidoreductase (luciferase family)
MRLGALLGPVPPNASPRFLADQARTLAGEGFESLWSVQAIGRGFAISDPFVALAVAAAVTDTVEIGTAVIQVPLYHPVDLAHRVFSLMQICGDRFLFGVGAGSTRKDFDALGRDYAGRFRTLSTSMTALRQLFADGRLADVELSPWPNVRGGPPLLLGAWGGTGVERAARSYAGWIASAAKRSPAEVVAALQRFRRAGGRRAIVSTIQLDASSDLARTKDLLAEFAEAGFDDAVVMLMPGGPSAAAVRRLV